jgi:superkiller protein 3
MKKIILILAVLLFASGKVHAQYSILDEKSTGTGVYNQFGTNKIDNSEIYTRLGISVAQQGQYTKAIECFNKAIKLDANSTSAYYNLAICYMKIDKTDLAIENFKKGNDIYPDYKSCINIGALYANQSMYDEAIKYLEQAKSFKEKDAALFHNLGIIYDNKGEHQKAIENFEKVLELDPKNKKAYYNIGIIYQHLGKNELAIENLNKAASEN